MAREEGSAGEQPYWNRTRIQTLPKPIIVKLTYIIKLLTN